MSGRLSCRLQMTNFHPQPPPSRPESISYKHVHVVLRIQQRTLRSPHKFYEMIPDAHTSPHRCEECHRARTAPYRAKPRCAQSRPAVDLHQLELLVVFPPRHWPREVNPTCYTGAGNARRRKPSWVDAALECIEKTAGRPLSLVARRNM